MAGKIDFDIDLRRRLESRGVRINPPATERDIARLERLVGGRLTSPIRSAFLAFDGFADMDFDQKTFISIWPVDRILENADSGSLPTIPFADAGLEAEIFCVDATDDQAPVLVEGQMRYQSYDDFWIQFLSEEGRS
jgi:hypothetical protein